MAKDSNDKHTRDLANETTTATLSLYKVGYTYAAPNGQLRSGSYIIEAATAEAAKALAAENIKKSGANHGRVVSAKPY